MINKQNKVKKLLFAAIILFVVVIIPITVSAYNGGVPPIVSGARIERVEKPAKPFKEQIVDIGQRIKSNLRKIFSLFFNSED